MDVVAWKRFSPIHAKQASMSLDGIFRVVRWRSVILYSTTERHQNKLENWQKFCSAKRTTITKENQSNPLLNVSRKVKWETVQTVLLTGSTILNLASFFKPTLYNAIFAIFIHNQWEEHRNHTRSFKKTQLHDCNNNNDYHRLSRNKV